MRRKLNILAGDKALWVIFLLLSVISLVAVYSTIGLSAISDLNSTPMRIFCRHLGFVVAAALIAIFVSHIKYTYFARASVILLYLSVAALIVVVIMGTKRWLVIPHVIRFEPSELAKIALIIYLARCIALRSDSLEESRTFRRLLIPILIVCVLVTPANLSTGILIFLTCYIMLLFGGVNRRLWWRGLLLLLGISLVGFLILYFFGNQIQIGRVPTWAHRFQSWIHPNPDELTQENMARMAVARGGFWGNGIGTTIHGRLMTQAHNDFILAIIIEEAGLLTAIVIFALYFGSLIVAGTGTLIFLQAVINISVAVGLLPVTGQTLPFISYGGTAYLCLGLGLGVIQAVAFRNKKLSRKAVAAPSAPSEPDTTVSETADTQQLN